MRIQSALLIPVLVKPTRSKKHRGVRNAACGVHSGGCSVQGTVDRLLTGAHKKRLRYMCGCGSKGRISNVGGTQMIGRKVRRTMTLHADFGRLSDVHPTRKPPFLVLTDKWRRGGGFPKLFLSLAF